MQVNEVSATPNTPSPLNTNQHKRQLCEYCGSILDQDGKHTDEWVRSWQGAEVQNGIKVQQRARIYRVWTAMRERCNNPKQIRYDSYGGRGIKICPEWDDYAVFLQWMMSQEYKPGLQIDRKDNDGNYSPANCRLVTHTQQMQNRRLPSRHRTGKRYNRTELTPEDIYTIRESDLSYSELGRKYNIHGTHARNIKLRMAWRDLPERASTNH